MNKNRLLVALALASALSAQAQTWIGGSGNLWSTPANWVGGVIPTTDGTAAVVFDGTALSFTPNMISGGWNIDTMTVTSPGYSFTGNPISFSGTTAAFTVTHPGCSMSNLLGVVATNVTLNNSADFTLTTGMAGAGNLTKAGAGTLFVTGTQWHLGSTTVAAGTLHIGDGASAPDVRTIVNAGAVVFDGNIDLLGAITGSGSITVEPGSFVTNLSLAPVAHQGSTTVHGTLNAGTASIDSNGPLLIATIGMFTVDGTGSVGSIAGTGQLQVNAGTLSTGSDGSSTTFSGPLSGSGGLRKTGAGTFTIASNSIVTGTLTVEAPGTLRIGNGTTGPSNSFSLVTNGALVIDRNGFYNINSSLAGTGTLWVEGNSTLSVGGLGPMTHQGSTTVIGALISIVSPSIDNNAPLVIGPLGDVRIHTATVGSLSGSGTLRVTNGILTAGGNDSSTTYSGVLSGSNDDFRKIGSGTLTLATNTWFNGDVTVEAPGTLRIGNGTTGPGVAGRLFVNGALVFDSPGMNLSGTLTGTGTIRVEAGRSVFNNSGQPLSHQGSTTVNGLLDATAPSTSIDNNASLVIGPSGHFVTQSGQVGSLSGSGQFTVGSGTFTIGGDNTSTTYSGVINGPGNFRKTGSGTLTLATNSFFGGTVIVEGPGALRLGNGSTGPGTVGTIGVDGVLFFNTPSINVGTISGSGSVVVQSGSTVFYGGPFPMSHSGPTTISGQFNSPSVAAIDNNAALLLAGGLVTRGGSVGSLSGSGTLQLTAGNLNLGGNNVSTTFSGPLSGAGSLTKLGNGTLTLSGSSPSFTGGVQIASGTLLVSGTLGTAGLVVVTGTTLTGTGSIVGPVNVETGANLSPGPAVAMLTTGNLAISGNLNIDVQGTIPGTQHDRLNVNGTVAINGATLALSGAYVPTTGNSITIIQNDGTDPVTGTFSGLPEGATLTFNGQALRITYVGGTGNDVVLSSAAYTVTPSAGLAGSISPNTAQSVAPGGTVTFTVIPNSGYAASVGGSCGGNLSGTTYTTNAVNADCTVVASFTLTTYTVTPSNGANGTISPNTGQPVAPGGTLTFTVSPSTGYTASVAGTCGGNLVGNTYTTNPVNANCSVVATFTLNTYTVTPTAGPNGTITPSTPQTVAHGSATNFTVTPDAGFTPSIGGTCGGSLAGTIYTTSPITASCTVNVTWEQANPRRLVNISTRMQVLTGDDVLVGGFVIGGSANKTVAVVGAGPSLASFGITNPLANPALTLVRSSDQTVIGINNDWQTASNAAQLQAAGLAPPNPLEAAILVNLAPGAYTAIVHGVGNTTGVGLIAVYEVDSLAAPIINISTRGRVLTGNDVMIGGFIIAGTTPQTVAIVGTGPSLTAFGITSPLANPRLTLVRSSDQAIIATNDDWATDGNASQLQAAGLAPSNALESAIYITLQPGAYTAILSGVGDTTGVGVIGVYKVN